ncbi:MAG: hypothetical protein GY842_26105 [bacterium]|nr:hypothetical protein [bacterium]
MPRSNLLAVSLLLALSGHIPAGIAQENEDCLKCHARVGLKVDRAGREIDLHVNPDRFEGSVHGDMDCVGCHTELDGVEGYPHQTGLERVGCGDCHEDEDGPIAAYWSSTHGQRVRADDPDAPLCQDCHGNHYILELSDPDSVISPFNVPQMCAQCHAEGAKVERTHDLPEEQVFQRYRQSIHGEGLFKQGLVVTAVCTSCHTGHNVLPHTDPRSSIHEDKVADTCRQCHGRIQEVHRKIIAGELWASPDDSERTVPVCVECHSPHEIREVFYSTEMSNADCLSCHGSPELVAEEDGHSLYVDSKEYGESIHGRKVTACAQCHMGVTASSDDRPCRSITERVNCSVCHEAEVAAYERGRHGRLHAAGDENAPYCTDCHGSHHILEHTVAEDAPRELKNLVRESPSYSRNVPELCGKCHREGGRAALRYFGTETHIIENYSMSIHGKGLLESGLTVTATCTDCHTPHKELPRHDTESSIHPDNIAETCGQCHDGIYEQYEHSIHSPTGNPEYERQRGSQPHALPRCNDCHTSHRVARTDVSDFKTEIMEQCGKCHEDVSRTYFDTYHGKASELDGSSTAARCQDCHGAHEIHPITDSRSMLHRDSIVATCAQCHPGSHRRFAGYLTHATHHDPEKYPALYWTFWGMTTLLVGTFTFFGLHTLAWLPRSWKLRKQHGQVLAAVDPRAKQFVRFTRFSRGLHLTVILSFFGLAITGMALKFSYTGWAKVLSSFLGGADTAAWIHRICALATFGYFALHLWDLWRKYRKSGKTWTAYVFGPNTMLPRWNDLREFWQTVKWFVGRGPRPHYGRWTYWEKFDYFAVFWGVAVIGATGLCLWFPEFFTRLLPGWAINVATIIHSDEALLATGFIFTIHFFNTHFRPEKFPMDTVIFTGRMTLEELRHDKPREYEELVASGRLEDFLADPVPLALTRGAKVFGFAALAIGFTLVGLIVYAMLFAYR